MRYFKKSGKRITGMIFAALLMAGVIFCGNSAEVFAVDGAVSAASANIRASANSGSEVLASVKSGDKVDIISSETGSDGYTWYKVYVSASSTGYIRSDLVSASGTVPASNSSSETTTPAAEIPETKVTSMESQGATVASSDVRVRKQASTSADTVASLKSGAAVTLTGTATGTDGKQWYQVNFINNGSNVTGFIRSDLLTLGDAPSNESNSEAAAGENGETEGETAEGTEEDETQEPGTEEDLADVYGDIPEENADYELKYTAGEDGVDTWYLYLKQEGVRLKLDELLSAVDTGKAQIEELNGNVKSLKITLVVLAVLLVLAAAAAGFLAYKMHEMSGDWEDDDDDEDDDDEDEDEDVKVAPRRRASERPVRKNAEEDRPVRRPVRRQEMAGRAPRPEGRPAGAANRPTGAANRPVRNTEGAAVRRPSAEAGSARPAQTGGRPASRQTAVRSKDHELGEKPAPSAAKTDMEKTPKKSGKSDVTWKSKNFLAEDDDLDFSFIDMDNDV